MKAVLEGRYDSCLDCGPLAEERVPKDGMTYAKEKPGATCEQQRFPTVRFSHPQIPAPKAFGAGYHHSVPSLLRRAGLGGQAWRSGSRFVSHLSLFL